MDQLLDFFKQMSPLQIVMLAGGIIIGWPVLRDNILKSPSKVIETEEEDDVIEVLTDQEDMETCWFLLYQACSNLKDEQAKEEVRSKMVDISKHIF